jgi:hypothetical protein
VDIDRRRLLATATCAVLTGTVCPARPLPAEYGMPDAGRCHPLTRSLLDRARRAGMGLGRTETRSIERIIHRLGEATGRERPLVIKWMDTPTEAFDHLCQFGLDALLDMGTSRFWRRAQPPAPRDEDTFERAFEVRMMANELLCVEEHDRMLMAPKLIAKSRAMSANRSDEEIFKIRAVSAQIGWLETSMAETAAQAVANVEMLLSSGASEASVAIDNQLRVFELYELGLFATWETTDALICVEAHRLMHRPSIPAVTSGGGRTQRSVLTRNRSRGGFLNQSKTLRLTRRREVHSS